MSEQAPWVVCFCPAQDPCFVSVIGGGHFLFLPNAILVSSLKQLCWWNRPGHRTRLPVALKAPSTSQWTPGPRTELTKHPLRLSVNTACLLFLFPLVGTDLFLRKKGKGAFKNLWDKYCFKRFFYPGKKLALLIQERSSSLIMHSALGRHKALREGEGNTHLANKLIGEGLLLLFRGKGQRAHFEGLWVFGQRGFPL